MAQLRITRRPVRRPVDEFLAAVPVDAAMATDDAAELLARIDALLEG